jgi:hypothetical protein
MFLNFWPEKGLGIFFLMTNVPGTSQTAMTSPRDLFLALVTTHNFVRHVNILLL